MPEGTPVILIDNIVHDRWDSFEVERSLDQFAHRFSASLFEGDVSRWEVQRGASCQVALKDGQSIKTLLTGYLNRIRRSVRNMEWRLYVDGRSTTGDLVDCSSTLKTGAWNSKTPGAIVKDLCEEYEIEVEDQTDDDQPFQRFAIEAGESVFETIDRICKNRAILPSTMSDGRLLLSTGWLVGPILDPSRIMDREFSQDDSQRFSQYLTQATGVGSEADAFVKAAATDLEIKRFRPLVIIGDAELGTAAAKNRAIWEANVRAGRGERIRYTVAGALNQEGNSYEPGYIYQITDPILQVDGQFLLERATLRCSAREMVSELEFTHEDAYSKIANTAINLTARTKRGKAIIKRKKLERAQ